jgi:type II secretory ATPase GspE/PulE/Tfp pilus assembly ATPase PilB-like protein
MPYNIRDMSENARQDEERTTLNRANLLGLNYVDTSLLESKPLYKDLLSNEELYRLKVIPLRLEKGTILFGITTTTSQQTMKDLVQRFADYKVDFAIISDTGFRDYMLLYDPPKQVVYQDIEVTSKSQAQINSVSQILEQVKADDMLAYLVTQAHHLNASDIHIETQRDNTRIRFRIDGVLHTVAELPIDKYRVLISAIASAGNVSTSADEAQQGHISQRVTMADNTEVDVNLRIETVPTINGMDVVMRLFNIDRSNYTLDNLGLSANERAVVDDIINKPSGLVLVVGPTGSGKTTTLYSMLNSLVSDERKVITIEDPVEFQFPGITQISVKSSESGNDSSFADKLRAILRLDPDIVMVGEIRDLDTAKTALQAALTGHLVLATFHASSAAASLTRLADIIGENPLFISAIRLIMAQRLIRKLDDKTKQAYQPSQFEINQLTQIVNSLPANVIKPDLTNLALYKPGSSDENPFGYQGQIAIREQMTMTETIRQLLTNQTNISAQSLELAARQDGMINMEQDGIRKVIAGITSYQELFRVIE